MTLQRMPSKNRVKEPYNMSNTPWIVENGFTLEDVNYDDQVVILVNNVTLVRVALTFEFIQDIAKYTNKEWTWDKNHSKNSWT